MQSWGCATCTKRAQAICGVGGYLGGEIVTAYLTGGAAAAIKSVTASAAKGAALATAGVAARLAVKDARLQKSWKPRP